MLGQQPGEINFAHGMPPWLILLSLILTLLPGLRKGLAVKLKVFAKFVRGVIE